MSQKDQLQHMIAEAVRDVVDTSIRPELNRLATSVAEKDKLFSELQRAVTALMTSVDRLSLVVMGGLPGSKGLSDRVAELDEFRRLDQLEKVKLHAKLAGIWSITTLVVVPLVIFIVKQITHTEIPNPFAK